MQIDFRLTIEIGSGLSELLQMSTTVEALGRIESKLDRLGNQGDTMAINVQALLAAVAAETTVDNSIIALLNQVVQNNKDLAAQLAAAIANNDPAAMLAVQKAIDDSVVTMQDNIANITNAVTTNTTT